MTERKKRTAAKPRKTAAAPEAARPDPTDAQKLAIDAARACWSQLPERIEMKMDVDGSEVRQIASPHSDAGGFTAMLTSTFGSRSHPFINTILPAVLKAAGNRGVLATQDQANAALAFVAAVAPTDELEASMAVQMFATSELSLEMLSRARHTEDRTAMVEYGNLATKLSRTFTAQMEALTKLRRGGEQVVKHVHVYEGGQAVVAGTINQRGGGHGKRLHQPYGTGAVTQRAALPCSDAAEDALSVQGDAERALSHSRRPVAGSPEE